MTRSPRSRRSRSSFRSSHPSPVRPLAIVDRTDEQLLELVEDIVRDAIVHRLWFFFLTPGLRASPQILQFDDVQTAPGYRDGIELGGLLCDVVRQTLAAEVVTVLERPGGRLLSDDDRAWVNVAHDAAHHHEFRFRGPLLVSDDGVRWLGADDL